MRREGDPIPWSWEPAAITVAVVTCLAILALQVGRSLAFALSGQGWVWPSSDQLLISVPHVLAGHTNSGLGLGVVPVSQALVAVVIVGTELLAFVGLGFLGWQLLVRFGPRALTGVASVTEANRLLGRSRLRRARKVVRPDLFAHSSEQLKRDGAP